MTTNQSLEDYLDTKRINEEGGPFLDDVNLTNSQMLGEEITARLRDNHALLISADESNTRSDPSKGKNRTKNGNKKRKKNKRTRKNKRGNKSPKPSTKDRVIMGQPLPFGGLMGANSFPGSDVTFTPAGGSTVTPTDNHHSESDDPVHTEHDTRAILGQALPLGGIFGADSLPGPGDTFTPADSDTPVPEKLDVSTKKTKKKQKHKKKRGKASRKHRQAKKELTKKKFNSDKLASYRAIMGGDLPLSDQDAGVDSFPGPDVTYTPPLQVTEAMVSLGCLNSTSVTDIVPVTVTWPVTQNPNSFSAGATGPNYGQVAAGGQVTFGGRAVDGVDGTPGQPGTTQIVGTSPGSGSFSQFEIGDVMATPGTSTPFQNPFYLSSDVSIYNVAATASGYASVSLSQEGLLWTLWPLTRMPTHNDSNPEVNNTYFEEFVFGTAKASKYPIGQMGFFINNQLQGCTPFGTVNPNSGWNPGTSPGQPGLNPYSLGLSPGVEGLNRALVTSTEQMAGIFCIKVTEQVARIYNTTSGISAGDRYIYVGYDGWSIIRTTANPVGPMASQTYVTPQSVTGSTVGDNYQIVFPPNFIQTMYYKNGARKVPIETSLGLFAGTAFAAAGTR